jgi:cytoskeletal protein RodZ
MTWFTSNKIFLDKESVAQQLLTTRVKKGYQLEEITKVINVNLRYLRAMEEGDYAILPAGIYGLNYLREYANFLDLDYEKLINKFKAEQQIYQSSDQRHLFARQTVNRKYFVAAPNVVKYSSIVFIAFCSLIYLWFLIQNIFVAPDLKIISPIQGLISGRSRIVVSGQTEPETEILINERQAIVSDKGEFSEELNLKPGVNTIVVTAQKAAKKKNTIIREVLFKETIKEEVATSTISQTASSTAVSAESFVEPKTTNMASSTVVQ